MHLQTYLHRNLFTYLDVLNFRNIQHEFWNTLYNVYIPQFVSHNLVLICTSDVKKWSKRRSSWITFQNSIAWIHKSYSYFGTSTSVRLRPELMSPLSLHAYLHLRLCGMRFHHHNHEDRSIVVYFIVVNLIKLSLQQPSTDIWSR